MPHRQTILAFQDQNDSRLDWSIGLVWAPIRARAKAAPPRHRTSDARGLWAQIVGADRIRWLASANEGGW